MTAPLSDTVEDLLGSRPVSIVQLGGGCVGDVAGITLADGRRIVAKRGDGGLDLEGAMLERLSLTGLPVPEVLHRSQNLLLMSFIDGPDPLSERAETHAADLIAKLHTISSDRFGYEFDTVIGGLHQPNPVTESWIDFFRDQRLLYMADAATLNGTLPVRLCDRISNMASKLDRWISQTSAPSLIHGDLWGGNVMCKSGRVAAFIDPAIYFADPEIELAFTTLFHSFGRPFFKRYQEQRTIEPGFFEERRHIYNLYPLLVHVRLFGGSYITEVERTLERFGC